MVIVTDVTNTFYEVLTMTKTYGELKTGDLIWFHGAEVELVWVKHYTTADGVNITDFKVKPHNAHALDVLGSFYGNAEYGGIDTLTVATVEGNENNPHE